MQKAVGYFVMMLRDVMGSGGSGRWWGGLWWIKYLSASKAAAPRSALRRAARIFDLSRIGRTCRVEETTLCCSQSAAGTNVLVKIAAAATKISTLQGFEDRHHALPPVRSPRVAIRFRHPAVHSQQGDRVDDSRLQARPVWVPPCTQRLNWEGQEEPLPLAAVILERATGRFQIAAAHLGSRRRGFRLEGQTRGRRAVPVIY